MMSEDDDRYRLPMPDLGAFGDETEQPPTAAGPAGERHGTMRFQDEHTTPRPPTLAEQHARQDAQRRQAEESQAAAVAAVAAQKRRRVMIGGGVTIGIVAVIAGAYLLSRSDDVTASCTASGGTNANTVVSDQNCDPAYAEAHGGHVSGGFVFLPLIGGGFQQYRYYYGGTGTIGQHVSGGSFTKPGNANIRTNSGRTIQRGGFGITNHGGSGGS
jgi:hypothetical protein